MQRTCKGCLTAKAPTDFYPKNTICKDCAKGGAQKRYRTNPALTEEQLQRKRAREAARSKQHRSDPAKRAYVIWRDTRGSDRKYGRANDLTVAFIAAATAAGCSYCGATDLKMTLDRIDNTLGHTTNNVVASCVRCNYMRRDMPHTAWVRMAPIVRQIRSEGLFGDWIGDTIRRRSG